MEFDSWGRSGTYLGSAISVDRYGGVSVGHRRDHPVYILEEMYTEAGADAYVAEIMAKRAKEQERTNNEHH